MYLEKMYAAYLQAAKNRKEPIGEFPYEISYMFQPESKGWFKLHDKEHFAEFLDKYELWEGLDWTNYTDYLAKANVGMNQQFCIKFI